MEDKTISLIYPTRSLKKVKVTELCANGEAWGRYNISNKSDQWDWSKWLEVINLNLEDEATNLILPIKLLKNKEVLNLIPKDDTIKLTWPIR